MPDASTDPTSSDPAPSRRARLSARRRRKTRVALVIVLVAVLAGAAAVGAYAMSKDTDPRSVGTADAPTTVPAEAVRTLPPIAAKTGSVRPLDHEHPLRLWVGGDSLAGSFGPALGDLVGSTGVVQTEVDFKVSSGLWSNDIRDWYQHATDAMTTSDPEVVMFIIGTNDTPAVNNVDANGDGVPDWSVDYRAKVDRMMDTLVGRAHRTVLWLGAPTLETDTMDKAAVKIDEIAKEEAAKRSADVSYVDTYKLFEGPYGGYSRQIVDDRGETITARISDGVHFSPAGANYLARVLYTLLDEKWHLNQQADRKHPIGWTFAAGSGEQVPGYTSTPRSRYQAPRRRSNYHSSYTTPRTYASNPTPTTSGGVSEATVPDTTPPPPPTDPPATTPVTDPPSVTTGGKRH